MTVIQHITLQQFRDHLAYISSLESKQINQVQTIDHLREKVARQEQLLTRIEALEYQLKIAREARDMAIEDLKAEREFWNVRIQMGKGMKHAGIPLKGFRLNGNGQIVRDQRRLDVSTRLKQKSSKKVRVARKGTA